MQLARRTLATYIEAKQGGVQKYDKWSDIRPEYDIMQKRGNKPFSSEELQELLRSYIKALNGMGNNREQLIKEGLSLKDALTALNLDKEPRVQKIVEQMFKRLEGSNQPPPDPKEMVALLAKDVISPKLGDKAADDYQEVMEKTLQRPYDEQVTGDRLMPICILATFVFCFAARSFIGLSQESKVLNGKRKPA